jgi:ubiquinone biosynthesis protein
VSSRQYHQSLFEVANRDVKRLRAVFAIIARHGFGEFILRSPLAQKFVRRSERKKWIEIQSLLPAPQRFKILLEDLGPTFVKFGQVLSMRADLIPQSFAEALVKLQDHVRPIAFEDVIKAIEAGLGGPVSAFFSVVEPTPIGSASISQAHLARTISGEKVVIKVQRPAIADQMRGDLDLLYILAKVLEAGIEEMQILGPSEIVAEFEKGLLEELNFGAELENLSRATQCLDIEGVKIPQTFPKLSSKTVLTMEFFEGKSLRSLVPHIETTAEIIERLVKYFIRQVLVHGFFHGDPHAGNILILPENQIGLIDFGLVGHLDESQREDIVNVLLGVLTRDPATIARMMLKIGTPTQRVNLSQLKEEVTRFMNQYFVKKSLNELDSSAVANDFLETANEFKIKLNGDYIVLFKALGSIEGLVRQMAPDINVSTLIRPIVEDFISRKISSKNLIIESLGGLLGVRSFLKQIPNQVEQILHDAESGYTQIRLVAPEIDKIPSILHNFAGRVILSLFAMTMTLCGLVILTQTIQSKLQLVLGIVSGSFAAIAWFMLFWWQLMGSARPIRVNSFLQFFRR